MSQCQWVYQLPALHISDLSPNTAEVTHPETDYKVVIYSNPTSNQLYIKTRMNNELVDVYFATGNLLFMQKGIKKHIYFPDFKSGMFFIAIKTSREDYICRKIMARKIQIILS